MTDDKIASWRLLFNQNVRSKLYSEIGIIRLFKLHTEAGLVKQKLFWINARKGFQIAFCCG
ncbi:hypothetical protein DU002_06340 [Corallincola holothuriorum]|uniref:Uncharacterized protein n=1 Tax=Corallincola holothuriorum TaxID=2282215 RepID=A0A368NN99_9GAMM|nr:hypothetical protein DU002_06340 [Corallincola holothuriorum]